MFILRNAELAGFWFSFLWGWGGTHPSTPTKALAAMSSGYGKHSAVISHTKAAGHDKMKDYHDGDISDSNLNRPIHF